MNVITMTRPMGKDLQGNARSRDVKVTTCGAVFIHQGYIDELAAHVRKVEVEHAARAVPVQPSTVGHRARYGAVSEVLFPRVHRAHALHPHPLVILVPAGAEAFDREARGECMVSPQVTAVRRGRVPLETIIRHG